MDFFEVTNLAMRIARKISDGLDIFILKKFITVLKSRARGIEDDNLVSGGPVFLFDGLLYFFGSKF